MKYHSSESRKKQQQLTLCKFLLYLYLVFGRFITTTTTIIVDVVVVVIVVVAIIINRKVCWCCCFKKNHDQDTIVFSLTYFEREKLC